MKHDHHSTNPSHHDPASFRDPSGFVFTKDGVLYRQVNEQYARSYDLLMRSGLYDELVRKEYLVPHEEVPATHGAYKLLKPERIPFISYPYEWCFSELRDAALLTLKVQKLALKFGMTLKDASAYNIQFRRGKPVLIDTLSFEPYAEGAPWVAYRQFCGHFLAPLALMSFRDIRLSQLLRIHLDGIPLDLASRLLPWKSWFNAGAFFHIHMHARSARAYAARSAQPTRASVDRGALEKLVHHLRTSVASLRWEPGRTLAGHGGASDPGPDVQEVRHAVERWIAAAKPKTIWDIGMDGDPSVEAGGDWDVPTVAFHRDAAAAERAYLATRETGGKDLLPLVLDITNPSPALGWANKERAVLTARGPADLVVALDAIHHLAIGNNVPLAMIAELFAAFGARLIIEFVPKDDPAVEQLLRSRADIFDRYSDEEFQKAFAAQFTIHESQPISGTKRTLYFMERR